MLIFKFTCCIDIIMSILHKLKVISYYYKLVSTLTQHIQSMHIVDWIQTSGIWLQELILYGHTSDLKNYILLSHN